MFLIRGVRRPNGRTDVICYSAHEEQWLRVCADRRWPKAGQYEWGRGAPDASPLAHDVLLVVTGNAEAAEMFADEMAEQWFGGMAVDRWSMASFEVVNWLLSELTNEVVRHRESPSKGGVPCPSEN